MRIKLSTTGVTSRSLVAGIWPVTSMEMSSVLIDVKNIDLLVRSGGYRSEEEEEDNGEDLLLDKERNIYITPYMLFLEDSKIFNRKGPNSANLVKNEKIGSQASEDEKPKVS